MNTADLEKQLADARALIRALEKELAETNRGLVALNLELDQRVEERTADLARTNEALRAEIARRIEAEEQLRRAKQAAEAANEAKDRFLAMIRSGCSSSSSAA